MRLIENVDLIKFLQQVKHCREDVLFTTKDGDILNLKSELSRYIFATVATKEDFILKGTIVCRQPADEILLHDFLLPDAEC